MDGAKKTLLATVFTAAIMVASAAAYAGVISVPEFNLSIPTPDQSAPSQPSQNMAIPTIPSGTQIPTTTQLPPSVAALPSIATSGQSGVPIYGNPVPSTDSTGASGATQNLASSCYASGGSWNPSTSTCSTNSTSSLSYQCTQMGGQYDWTKNQCQMASLPGSSGGYGWASVAGKTIDVTGYLEVKRYGGPLISRYPVVSMHLQVSSDAKTVTVSVWGNYGSQWLKLSVIPQYYTNMIASGAAPYSVFKNYGFGNSEVYKINPNSSLLIGLVEYDMAHTYYGWRNSISGAYGIPAGAPQGGGYSLFNVGPYTGSPGIALWGGAASYTPAYYFQ